MNIQQILQILRYLITGISHKLFNTSYYYKGIIKLDIDNTDIVLHVGSGTNPNLRADICLEKFIADRTEKKGKVTKTGHFIIGDVNNLPFLDNSINYVLCPQVVEHLSDPKQALEELSRISKKGYIETPKPIVEIAHPASYHKWFVKVENDRLKFIGKNQEIFNIGFNKNLPSGMKRPKKYREDFNTIYQYYDSINFEIIKKSDKKRWISAKIDNNYNLSTDLSSLSFSKKIVRKLINKKKNFDIYEILACPICKKNLYKVNNNLICHNCHKKYPIVDDVPILLKEKARNMERLR